MDPALDKVLALLPSTWTSALRNALRHFRTALMEVYEGPKRRPLPPTLWALVYVTCARGELIEGSFTGLFEGNSRETLKRKRVARRPAAQVVGATTTAHRDSGVASASASTGAERLTVPQPKRKKGAAGAR